MNRRALVVGPIVIVTLACASAALAQDPCGGIAGIPCPPDQFCQLAPGECCCDFMGVCVDVPQGCPAVCDPVCGCDGITYSNRCEADAARVSVDHLGPCDTGKAMVTLGQFTWQHRLYWPPVADAAGYNVYVADTARRPRELRCLYAAVPETSVLLKGSPAPGDAWAFRVTALLPGGEGPLGPPDDCGTQAPSEPCVCTLPADVGPCDAAIPRWHHDHTTGRCEAFVWGGCGGNANNFETEAACVATCLDPCAQPAVQGDCEAAIPRWYHNVLSGRCEMFVWGGCGGNGNNFPSLADCQDRCAPPAVFGVADRWGSRSRPR